MEQKIKKEQSLKVIKLYEQNTADTADNRKRPTEARNIVVIDTLTMFKEIRQNWNFKNKTVDYMLQYNKQQKNKN